MSMERERHPAEGADDSPSGSSPRPTGSLAPRPLPIPAQPGSRTLPSSVGSWDWDLAADVIKVDAGFAELFDMPRELAEGGSSPALFVDAVHKDDRPLVEREVNRALREAGSYTATYRVLTKGGGVRWVAARGAAFRDTGGKASRLIGVAIDITEQRTVEDLLRSSEVRLELLANSIDQMVWSTRPDGFHDYYNARWYEFTGVPPGSTDGEAWNGMFHPDDRERAWAVWRDCLATGQPYHIEYRLRHRSGEYRWVIGRAQCVRDDGDRIVRWYGTCTDIHDLKLAEEARETVMRELSHRIKNIFAVVGSLVALSGRETPQSREWAARLLARIEALGQAHEYVRPHGPESLAGHPPGGSVHGLIGDLLAAYEVDGGRIHVEGCDMELGPRAASALALLVHELGTNAVKHGALSAEGGQIRIACRDEGEAIRLVWQEEGGPPIAEAPVHRGFGSELSERVATSQLRATIERRWEPGGLRLELALPRPMLAV